MSKLILGTVQFGLNYGVNNQKGIPSSNEIKKILFTKQSAYENINGYEIFMKEQYDIPENNPEALLNKI